MASLDQGQTRKRSPADEATPPSPGKVPRRKYKRHPKPDAHAPERPLTAYVRFSKDKRKEYQERRLSFSELAKQIGIDWQDLSPTTKNRYLTDASTDWTNFRKALDDYHATPEYADYVQYLRDFASDNPDSNVKLPQSDEPSSPSHVPQSASWDAEGSPTSEEEPYATMTSDHPSATQVQSELDMAQFHYDLAQDHMSQPRFLTQDAIAQHAAMNPIQEFDYHGNAAFQNSAQPNFADPWQQQQQQQQPMHLSSIGPSSRFSRTNTSLTQALSRASDSRAHELEHSQDSSANATPDSDLLSGNRGSSMSSAPTSASPAHTRGPMSASAMYGSAVMPNNFAHSLGPGSTQQAMDSKYSTQAQQQQQQQLAHNQTNGYKTSYASDPQADVLSAAFNVNPHYYDHDIWMSSSLDQNFIANEFQDSY